MNTGHTYFKKLLSSYIFGELDEETARRLERHLAHCEDCSRALRHEEELHRSLEMTLAHRLIDSSYDLAGAVLSRIEEEKSHESICDRVTKVFDMRLRPAAAYALAASIGLAVGILPLFTFFTPTVTTAEEEPDPLAIEYLMDAPPQSLTAFFLDREVTDE